MAWDDAKRAKAIADYTGSNPTPTNTQEIIASIAEDLGESVNGVRLILSKAGVYVKQGDTAKPKPAVTKTATKADGTAKVTKADSINALVAAIKSTGYILDREIVDKLTGKQAIYFTAVIKAASVVTEVEEVEPEFNEED
jgi:hypothetical protein